MGNKGVVQASEPVHEEVHDGKKEDPERRVSIRGHSVLTTKLVGVDLANSLC